MELKDYTEESNDGVTVGRVRRARIHNSLKAIDKSTLSYIMRNYIPNRSIEYNDNRISKFVA